MRTVIIVFSIFFFSLSGIIFYKTAEIPPGHIQNQTTVQSPGAGEPRLKEESTSGRTVKEREVKWSLVQNRQAMKSDEWEGLSNKGDRPSGTDQTGASLIKKGVLVVLGDGMFRPGQYFITPDLRATIQDFVPEIMAFPEFKVVIEGHTDNVQSAYMDNTELSYLRAKAVGLILTKNGVSPEQISVIGYGDTRPVASNDTAEGRSRNRRVEVKLVHSDKDF